MKLITAAELEAWNKDGYVVKRALFSKAEVESYIDHFMQLRESGTYEGDFSGVDLSSTDPLKKYPRMIHMHPGLSHLNRLVFQSKSLRGHRCTVFLPGVSCLESSTFSLKCSA